LTRMHSRVSVLPLASKRCYLTGGSMHMVIAADSDMHADDVHCARLLAGSRY